MNEEMFLQGTETIRAHEYKKSSLECTIYSLDIFFISVRVSGDFYFTSSLITYLKL